MADNQVQNQDGQNQEVPQEEAPVNQPQQQGCGCGNTQRSVPAAMAERIKGRLDKVYKTRSKVF